MEDDIHKKTAALIFNKREKDVTPQERTHAKWMNFIASYGVYQGRTEAAMGGTVQVTFVHEDGDETHFSIELEKPPSRTLMSSRGLRYPCGGAFTAAAAIKNMVGRIWRDRELGVPRVIEVCTEGHVLRGMLEHDELCSQSRTIYLNGIRSPPYGYDLTGVVLRTPAAELIEEAE